VALGGRSAVAHPRRGECSRPAATTRCVAVSRVVLGPAPAVVLLPLHVTHRRGLGGTYRCAACRPHTRAALVAARRRGGQAGLRVRGRVAVVPRRGHAPAPGDRSRGRGGLAVGILRLLLYPARVPSGGRAGGGRSMGTPGAVRRSVCGPLAVPAARGGQTRGPRPAGGAVHSSGASRAPGAQEQAHRAASPTS
jgi:hypothetical protein